MEPISKKIKLYPDIFNDVFGPVMQPGSSSHTAGPCRIGYVANSLLKGKLAEIKIVLDKDGSFSGTFGHMDEDLGMLAGAYGLLPDDARLFDIKSILSEEKIIYAFEFSTIEESSHANAAKFILTDENGDTVTLVGNSTGGGMIEIVNVLGRQLSYRGEEKVSLAELTGDEKLEGYLFTPVLPVTLNPDRREQLFDSFTGWRKYAEDENIDLFEAAIDYEIAATGWSREKIINSMNSIQSTMHNQVLKVYGSEEKLIENPFSGYHFRNWKKYTEENKTNSGEVVSRALYLAFGGQTMSKGTLIVPGPMGNGGAYIYSVLKAVAEDRGLKDYEIMKALFVAGIVGAIGYTRTEPTGEVIGCTGECGMCSAMAAAGLTYMLSGTPEEVENAASLTLQATIGWPCDPIPGGLNQPCTSRVVSAVTLAFTFTDLALSGKKAVIPFHEAVDTADRVGRALPSDLKCTSCGGLCATASGINAKKDFENWRNRK